MKFVENASAVRRKSAETQPGRRRLCWTPKSCGIPRKHLLKNGLPQLPLGPEAYYNKLRLKEARQAAVQEEDQREEAGQQEADQHDEDQQGRDLPEEIDGALRDVVGEIVADVAAQEQEAGNEEAAQGQEAGNEEAAQGQGNEEAAAANNSGRLVALNRSENLHTPMSSFALDVNVPFNSAATIDNASDVLGSGVVINQVPEVTPPPPKVSFVDFMKPLNIFFTENLNPRFF
ncbi:hypothetical protein JTE90_000674 [Oedothorax gibbosus]|uniref:Uncharacterized protein n=1 Tax=Oedothorax gibbosus TaxID=931172 RepID=A0AAV6VYI0_9ARAC|nr:hypothetical protein JTE90_000674 [Oedothorax gibbosus]